jgi:putative ABC transport system substrate-binding protein
MRNGRRRALSLIVGLVPAATLAQQPARVATVGYLTHGAPGAVPGLFSVIGQRLRHLGWVEGRNVKSEYRYADRKVERLEALAAELIARQVDVLVAMQTVSAHAAKKASREIPIVFATSDPQGLVVNLARPEGNLTGISNIGAAIAGKQLQLIKELTPKASRAVAVANPENPSTRAFAKDAEAAARSLGLRLEVLERRDPAEIDRLLRAMAQPPDFLVVQNDAYFHSEMKRLVELVATLRLPAIYGAREFPAAGGLVSYGANLPATYADLGNYIDKILRGAKPRDLPVTQPTKFELVVNARTAKSLGLTLPAPFLHRADEVIQ